jgi:hypothetical protein
MKRDMTRLFPIEKVAMYGTEGEFYLDEGANETILDYNNPPSTQPGLWCCWQPSENGIRIVWNGAAKFYHYVEWLEYITKKILQPQGYFLNGKVNYQGEEEGDKGSILCVNNEVRLVRSLDELRNPPVFPERIVTKPLDKKSMFVDVPKRSINW